MLTEQQIASAKYRARTQKPEPKFSGTLLIEAGYFNDKVTDLRKNEDSKRYVADMHLSNEQITIKINEQIQREYASRKIALDKCPSWVLKLEWNQLLRTKLFNSPQQ